jgi:iron complex transport system permease protein
MKNTKIIYLLLLVSSILAIYLSISFGSYGYVNILSLIFDDSSQSDFLYLRVPRVILGFIAGAGLALTGVILQTFFRNDLCSDSILGISSFACLGGTIALFIGVEGYSVELFSFFGSFISLIILVSLLNLGYVSNTSYLLLIGISFSLISSSLIGFFQFLGGPEKMLLISKWLEGGLQIVDFGVLILPGISLIVLFIVALWHSKELDLIQVSLDYARARGVNIERSSIILIISISLFVGVLTSICGPISFVGLIIPHIARNFVSSMHFRLLITSAFIGGIFLVLIDLIARVLIAPAELPVGILTGLIGAPFFLFLLFFRQLKR